MPAPSKNGLLTPHPHRLVLVSLLIFFLSPLGAWAEERREPVDADKNGKPEEWKVYDGPTLVRIERDRDGDGKPEIWIHLKDGKPVRSEVDRNGDGKPDLIRWMTAGRPERERADLNGDGKVDAWIFYKDGLKDLMIMDKNYDGRPDAWFYYGQAGLKLIGGRMDQDFDGTVDRTWGSVPDKEDRKPW